MENNEFFEKLIAAVQQHPVLYDKTNKNYFNILVKQKVWKRIAAECEKTVSECKHRWKLLRERYAKELKKMECSSGNRKMYKEPWFYFESLGFLKQSLVPRRTRVNTTIDSSLTCDIDPIHTDNSHNDSEFTFSSFLDENEDDNCSRKSKHFKEDNGLQEISEAVKSLQGSAAQLIALVPPEKPSLVSAHLKTIELLLEDLAPDVLDEFFTKIYGEITILRAQARQTHKQNNIYPI